MEIEELDKLTGPEISRRKTPESYRGEFVQYGCFNPDCKSGFELECHHIIPKSKGGKDEFENYIILCRQCHMEGENHSNYTERCAALWTWKFYFESKIRAESQLSLLYEAYPQSEDRERGDSPKVLQFNLPVEIPQSAEIETERVRERAEPAPEKVPSAYLICPVCEKQFPVFGFYKKQYCSNTCRVVGFQLRQLRKLLDEFYYFIEGKMKAGLFRF